MPNHDESIAFRKSSVVPRIARCLGAVTALVFVGTLSACGSNDSSGLQNSDPTVAGYGNEISSSVLLDKQARTVLDQMIGYPTTGETEITSAIITIPPGASTGWHYHKVPLYVYVMEGTVTVTYDTEGGEVVKEYTEGSAILEAIGTHHEGRNTGKSSVTLLVVYIGAVGSTSTVSL